MPSSSAGTKSVRNPGRKPKGGGGGQLDILSAYDTRYPDIKNDRKLPGNGPRPKNPFGKEIAPPNVG